MPGDLTLLVCEPLRRETAAALDAPGLEGVRVATVPAGCDATAPERAELSRALALRLAQCGSCCVVGGGCLQGLEAPRAGGAALGVLRGDTCFELLVNRALVEHWIAGGAHLVTPGWLARWPERLARWGLDRATAAALFGEGATRLLLLDTGVDPRAAERLRALAEHVALPAEIAPVGLDHYRLVLREVVRAARVTPGERELAALRRRAADGAAVIDFVGRLAGATTEDEAVARLLELAASLLAPERIVYCPVEGAAVGPARLHPAEARPSPELEAELRGLAGDAAPAASARGLLFRVGDERGTLGLCAVDGLAFPEYRDRYLELVRDLARGAAVVVGSARGVERAARAEAAERRAREEVERGLHEALESVQTLRGLLPICASCKRIRDGEGRWTQLEAYVSARSAATFTHGLCPSCYARLYPDLDP